MINGFQPTITTQMKLIRFPIETRVLINKEIEELQRIERIKEQNKNPTEEQKNLYARSIQRRVKALNDLGLTIQEILDLE